jgi:O-antigen/teichoic acid export membrane protein
LSAAQPAAARADGLIAEGAPTDPVRGRTKIGALGRAASGTFALNVGNTIAVVIVTAVLARVMTLADFGLYSWAVATVTLLTVPAVLGVDRLLVRNVAIYLSRDSFGLIRGIVGWAAALVLATGVLLAVAVAVLAWVTSDGPPSAATMALTGALLALPILALGRVAQSAAMGAHSVVISQIPELALRPALLVGLVVGVVYVFGGPLSAWTATLLYSISALGAVLLSLVIVYRRVIAPLGVVPAVRQTREWTGAAVALALISGGLIVNSQMGIVLLGLLDTPESAGLYFVAQRGAQLIAFPLLAVNVALAPTAARLWAAREVDVLQRLVTRSARWLLLLSLPLAVSFIFFGGTLLGVAFGAPFIGASETLTILVLGQLANAATGSVATLLIMSGNQWRAGLGIIAGMVINLVLAIVLIPTLHAQGAAIAASASLVVSNGIHVLLARRTLGIDSTALGLPVAKHQ